MMERGSSVLPHFPCFGGFLFPGISLFKKKEEEEEEEEKEEDQEEEQVEEQEEEEEEEFILSEKMVFKLKMQSAGKRKRGTLSRP
jgi:flagellar biosynthesis component FlhA